MHYARKIRNGDVGQPDATKIIDGRTEHYLYSTWSNMKQRCYNPKNTNYYKYGAKGITICDEWLNDFWAFVEDMGDRPEGYTLDRINTYGNYCKSNCRWASIGTQNLNLRVRKTSKSGVPGVTWYARYNAWEVKHKNKYIGRFKDIGDAISAKNKAINEQIY